MTNWLTWSALVVGINMRADGFLGNLCPEKLPDTGTEPSPPGPPK
jgi:hypothetical protein